MQGSLSDVRAVLFDAVGTVLVPVAGVAEAYHRAAVKRGSELTVETIAARFPRVRTEEEASELRAFEGRTDEAQERARWRRIVARVVDDVADVDGLLAELWEHFGQPAAWRTVPEAVEAALAIAGSGRRVAWASNFDERLPRMVAGMPELAGLGEVFVSSQLGYRKPHAGFFRAIERRLGLRPSKLLLVGDDRAYDFEAAQAAGWSAWLAPVGESLEVARSYRELLEFLAVAQQ